MSNLWGLKKKSIALAFGRSVYKQVQPGFDFVQGQTILKL